MPIYLEPGIQDSQLIYDTDAQDIVLLEKIIAFTQRQTGSHRPISLFLPDFPPYPRDAPSFYQTLSSLLATHKIGTFIAIGLTWDPQATIFQLPHRYVYTDLANLLTHLPRLPIQGHAIIIKNNPTYQLDPLYHLLRENNHTTTLAINLDAIANNLQFFQKKLAPSTQIIAMVKANAYGTSKYEVGQFLQSCPGVSYLAVCYIQEGINLRKSGIHLPIMVMNPSPACFDQLADYRLEPALHSLSLVTHWISWIQDKKINLDCHLELDTGMHRLGLMPNDLPGLLQLIQGQPFLSIKSVFSHWAAPTLEHAAFTHEQARLFETLAKRIEKALARPLLKHLSNTVGIEHFPTYQFDMVRIGIGLYGMSSILPPGLIPAVTLKTTVAQIKSVPAGATVGYERKGMVSQPIRLAILNIGYADGFKRNIGQDQRQVWINGQLASVVGHVCMDMTMVDVTNLAVEEGDEAIIFGTEWPPQRFIEANETIPHEALTSVGARVRRIYYKSL
jgi:alanine racemase